MEYIKNQITLGKNFISKPIDPAYGKQYYQNAIKKKREQQHIDSLPN